MIRADVIDIRQYDNQNKLVVFATSLSDLEETPTLHFYLLCSNELVDRIRQTLPKAEYPTLLPMANYAVIARVTSVEQKGSRVANGTCLDLVFQGDTYFDLTKN